jgi:hypothetical protein
MKESYGWDTKLPAVLLVLGLPLIGAFLLNNAFTVGDDTMMYIGLFLILLFPLVITLGIMRGSPKVKRVS